MFAPDDYTDGVMYGCQRVFLEKGAKFTEGGTSYVVVGTSKEGSTVFEPLQQHAARRPKSPYLKGENISGLAMGAVSVAHVYEVEKPLAALPPKELSARYNAMLDLLFLEKEDRDYLHSEGFTDEMIEKYKIVSFPEPDGYRFNNDKYHTRLPYRTRIGEVVAEKFGGTLAGVPGAYQNSKGRWTFAGLGGIIFPEPNYDGNIVAIRIRVKRRWYGENGQDISKAEYDRITQRAKAEGKRSPATELGKYMYLSSYKEDEAKLKEYRVENRYTNGCRCGSCLGFFKPLRPASSSIVYVTEGEKKAIIASNKLGASVINIPGVGLWSMLFTEDENGESILRRLRKKGCNIIVVAYDSDKEYNKAVLNFEQGLVDALVKEAWVVGVANWDSEKGKGLDDLLNAGYRPSYEILV